MQQLTIVIGNARHVLDTGVGVVYRAPVQKVIEGELGDRVIGLHVYLNEDGRLYSGQFRSFEQPPVMLRFSLVPKGGDPLHDHAPYEGFTAKDGTRWKLVSVEPK